jgi:hypothetical protein
MPLKWHKCSGLFGYIRRVKIAVSVVADVREKSAE